MKKRNPRKSRVSLNLLRLIRSRAFTTAPASLSQPITHPPGALSLIDLICHWDVILRMGPKTETGYVHSKEEWLAHSRTVFIFMLLLSGPITALSKAMRWEERYRDRKTFPESYKLEPRPFPGSRLGKQGWGKNSESPPSFLCSLSDTALDCTR